MADDGIDMSGRYVITLKSELETIDGATGQPYEGDHHIAALEAHLGDVMESLIVEGAVDPEVALDTSGTDPVVEISVVAVGVDGPSAMATGQAVIIAAIQRAGGQSDEWHTSEGAFRQLAYA